MIVYANEFLLATDEKTLSKLKSSIKWWLGKKIGPEFRGTKIIPFQRPFRLRKGDTGMNEVMIVGTPDHAADYCLSINYRHNDESVRGRAWFTRIGIERTDAESPIRVTILLETSEVSPKAAASPVTASQPGIVHAILRGCQLDPSTPGATVRKLTPANVEEFRTEMQNPGRSHVLVVVSPDDFSEVPHVAVEEMRQRLLGLAQIYQIPTKRDAWKLRDGLLPNYHTAWDGSVTVISPPRRGESPLGRVFRADEMEAIALDTNQSFDRHLFNDLTHRFNLIRSRRHISEDVVSRRLVSFKIKQLREQAATGSGELDEIVKSYEEDRNQAQSHANDLENRLLEAEIGNEGLRQKIGELEKRLRTLLFQLKQARTTTSAVASHEPAEPTLPESISLVPEWIEAEAPGCLVFTGRAKRTLKDSPFEDLEKVAQAFRVLATGFYAAFLNEIPFADVIDTVAEIPARYSGKQSEVTAGMKDGYNCTHNGVNYSLQRHIGIGTARDPRFCFRIYFEWDPKQRQIIVLHAGMHLDTKST